MQVGLLIEGSTRTQFVLLEWILRLKAYNLIDFNDFIEW